DGNTVTLQVRDKGKGMPAQSYLAVSGSVRPGVGIQGMRERVRQLGGRLEIDSGHGGTSVRAILPVKASASVGDKVAHTAMCRFLVLRSRQVDRQINHAARRVVAKPVLTPEPL